jgi:hypothetical protein
VNESTIIKGNQYDHGSITFKLGDFDLSGGVKEIKYGWKRTRGSLRGASPFRRGRTKGVVDFEGSIVLYKYMFDLLVDTFGDGWAELGLTIVVQYGNDEQPVRVDTLEDVEFNSTEGGSSEGEDPNEVSLELDIMNLLYNGKRPIKGIK